MTESRIHFHVKGTARVRIRKPSVGMDDLVSVICASSEPPHAPVTDRVARREFCARLDGFEVAEQVRTDRRLVVIGLITADEALQWIRTRPGGQDDASA